MNTNNLTVLTLNEPSIKDFAAARNRMIKDAPTDWILFLDSDETLTDELKIEINKVIENPKFQSYSLSREDYFLGKKILHGENAHNTFTRLIKKGSGRYIRPVHEVWETKNPVGKLKNPLIHNLPNIQTFINKINSYSTLESSFRYQNGIKSSLFHIFFFPFGKFLENYLVRAGFMDGIPGMIMAALMSFHSYLTWSKLYILWQKK